MMIPLIMVYALSIGLLAIGLAGIALERHLIVILLAVEVIFIGSTVALVGFFSTSSAPSPDAVIMLFAIFSVAAAEVITLVTFYIYMKYKGIDFDVTKLSRLKW
jgi:NADH:ubiquinone oxidoreductase subunit K